MSYYITTPIYYANAEPHIGSAYTTLAADVLARWRRTLGEAVFFLTGTDEHGDKIAQAATAAGVQPRELADRISATFVAEWRRLNIRPDGFIRTTDPRHVTVVREFLERLYDRGAIYRGKYRGMYCDGCEEFKTELQIGPDNKCPIHGAPLTEVAEDAYLFKLSMYQEKLRELIDGDVLAISPPSRKREALGLLEGAGLRDIAISRQRVSWGIPLPWDGDQTVYVWIDALINYYSAAQSAGPIFDSGKKPVFPPALQLIGKDILRFHALVWPALLLAADLPRPQRLAVHGFFTVNGEKMSKSRGNVVSPRALVERYGVDGARYVLLAAVPFGADGDVSFSRLDAIYNAELAHNLGNLVSRITQMIELYRSGNVPNVAADDLKVTLLKNDVARRLEDCQLAGALGLISRHVSKLNVYIDATKPWQLAKDGAVERLGVVLATLAADCAVVGRLLTPFMPQAGQKIAAMFETSAAGQDYDTLKASRSSRAKFQLFPALLPPDAERD